MERAIHALGPTRKHRRYADAVAHAIKEAVRKENMACEAIARMRIGSEPNSDDRNEEAGDIADEIAARREGE